MEEEEKVDRLHNLLICYKHSHLRGTPIVCNKYQPYKNKVHFHPCRAHTENQLILKVPY